MPLFASLSLRCLVRRYQPRGAVYASCGLGGAGGRFRRGRPIATSTAATRATTSAIAVYQSNGPNNGRSPVLYRRGGPCHHQISTTRPTTAAATPTAIALYQSNATSMAASIYAGPAGALPLTQQPRQPRSLSFCPALSRVGFGRPRSAVASRGDYRRAPPQRPARNGGFNPHRPALHSLSAAVAVL